MPAGPQLARSSFGSRCLGLSSRRFPCSFERFPSSNLLCLFARARQRLWAVKVGGPCPHPAAKRRIWSAGRFDGVRQLAWSIF